MCYGESAETEIVSRLWHSLLKDHIRELNYEAETAYIHSSVEMVSNGLEVSVSGFNDSIPTYLN